jgi:4a-hydroxytetrahydrobiopterin dehydratase
LENLVELTCKHPSKDALMLTKEEVGGYKSQIPDWRIVEHDGIRQLERVFKFKNFAEALAFTNRVGALAEEQDHHPALLTEWGQATVRWWTHVVRGLHMNDLIQAAKTDRLFTG